MRRNTNFQLNSRRVTPMRNTDIPSPQDPFDLRQISSPVSKPNNRTGSPSNGIRLKVKNDFCVSNQIENFPQLPRISKTPNPEINIPNNELGTNLSLSRTCNVTMERMTQISDKKNKLDVDFDTFFLSLSDTPIWSAVELFISCQIRGSTALYWQENASINTLYCPKIKKAVLHSQSIIGFAFFQRSIVKIANASEHPSFDIEIDSQIVNPQSTIILFPLFDYSNNLIAIIEIVRKRNEKEFLQSEEQLIKTFQRKFQSFSKWILESSNPTARPFIFPQMMSLMYIEQYVLELQNNLRRVFGCTKSEIWEKNGDILLRHTSEKTSQTVDVHRCGIINDIIYKAQIFNTLNCKYSSSYCSEIDEDYETVLASPIYDTITNTTYVIVLRGKENGMYTVDDEHKLRSISEMLVIAFKNAKFVSNPDTQSNFLNLVTNSLPKPKVAQSSKEILSLMMKSLQKYTKADRSTFYIVDWFNKEVVSVYGQGLKKAIKLEIGKGYAGFVAEEGVSMNTADVYHQNDPYFDRSVDQETSYVTKSLLTVPILDSKGNSISVIQLLNRRDNQPFSKNDEAACKVYGTICSCLMENASLKTKLEDLEFHSHQFQSIIDTTDFSKIVNIIKDTIQCEKCDIFQFDEAADQLLPLTDPKENIINIVQQTTNYHNHNNNKIGNSSKLEKDEGVTCDFFGLCFQKGQTFYTNNTYSDRRLDGFPYSLRTAFRSFYVSPLKLNDGKKLGIIKILNKKGDFTENNINHLKMFSFLISTVIENSINKEVIEKGILHLDIRKYITMNEYGKHIIPAHFHPTEQEIEQINSIDFRSSLCDEYKLEKIIFYAFEITGIMKSFKIRNNKLYKFIDSVRSQYKDVPFHNWKRAIDVLQYFLYEFKTAQLNTIFHPDEIISLVIASICCYVGNDGSNDKFQTLTESPISILYPNDRILETDQCSTTIHLMRDPQNDILEDANETDKKKIWQMIVKLMLETNIYKPSKAVSQFEDILQKSMLDLNNEIHRNLLIIFLFKAAIASQHCREFTIAEELREKEKEEMILLGNEEIKRKIQISSQYNCNDLYNIEKMYKERKEFVLPNFKYVAAVFADLKHAYKIVKKNFDRWIPTK